jgi:hypothetical protein
MFFIYFSYKNPPRNNFKKIQQLKLFFLIKTIFTTIITKSITIPLMYLVR